MNTNYTPSDLLLAHVMSCEGYRDTAYRCPAGVWTIGYGHTRDVHEGDKCNQLTAMAWLRIDMKEAVNYVNRLGVCKTQGQFDALCDFAFNCGTYNLGKSTLLKRIKEGYPTRIIQKEFKKWVYAKGRILPGLVNRRNWEAKRYAE